MAKKALHIILVLVLNLALAGVVVHKHYSHGQLFDVAMYHHADSCCEVPCSCCDDEAQVYQLMPDFLKSHTDIPDVLTLDLWIPAFLLVDLEIFKLPNFQIPSFLSDVGPPLNVQAWLQVFRC